VLGCFALIFVAVLCAQFVGVALGWIDPVVILATFIPGFVVIIFLVVRRERKQRQKLAEFLKVLGLQVNTKKLLKAEGVWDGKEVLVQEKRERLRKNGAPTVFVLVQVVGDRELPETVLVYAWLRQLPQTPPHTHLRKISGSEFDLDLAKDEALLKIAEDAEKFLINPAHGFTQPTPPEHNIYVRDEHGESMWASPENNRRLEALVLESRAKAAWLTTGERGVTITFIGEIPEVATLETALSLAAGLERLPEA